MIIAVCRTKGGVGKTTLAVNLVWASATYAPPGRGRRSALAAGRESAGEVTSRTASCHCGQLSATAIGEPVRVSVYHCLDCQKRSGSAFAGLDLPEPRFSVWEKHKHPWVEILGDQGEHSD